MKVSGAVKRVVAFLGAVILGYVLLFAWIEHRRTMKGPWQIEFTTVGGNQPAIIINQPRLGITNVEITFPAAGVALATSERATLTFGKARPVPFDVPYGRCVFQDTTFLPGTVTLQLFGHEIELLPKVLVVDHVRQEWTSGARVVLEPARGSR